VNAIYVLGSASATITNWLVHVHGAPAYAVAGALVFSETALFVGFFIPGESAVVVGGVLASVGSVRLWLMMTVVVACAIAGDNVGFIVGETAGPRLLARSGVRGKAAIARTAAQVDRHGGPAVLLARFIPFGRAVVPGIAGVSRMRYRTFLVFNLIGGVLWGVSFTLLGYFIGRPFLRVLSDLRSAALVVLGFIAVLILGHTLFRQHRRSHPTGSG
jgi:membrane-associated protein